jgi:BON domain
MSDRPTTTNQEVIAQIHDTLAQFGIHVLVEVSDGTVTLSGEVDSEDNRQAALDVAHAVADPLNLRVDDTIDVLPDAPETLSADTASIDRGGFGYLDPDRDDNLVLDQGYDAEPGIDDIGTTDSMEAAEEAIPYFPPTDPVVRPTGDDQELEVVGGFEATAMDGDELATGYDNIPEEEITENVLRELRQDASTTDLVIHVVTRSGVVHLRGEVTTLEDAENAEAVASRVDGVKEVREELEVASIRDTPRR